MTTNSHTSEAVLGDPEVDVKLRCAISALHAACVAFRRAESLWGVDARAFDEAFIECGRLTDKALALAGAGVVGE